MVKIEELNTIGDLRNNMPLAESIQVKIGFSGRKYTYQGQTFTLNQLVKQFQKVVLNDYQQVNVKDLRSIRFEINKIQRLGDEALRNEKNLFFRIITFICQFKNIFFNRDKVLEGLFKEDLELEFDLLNLYLEDPINEKEVVRLWKEFDVQNLVFAQQNDENVLPALDEKVSANFDILLKNFDDAAFYAYYDLSCLLRIFNKQPEVDGYNLQEDRKQIRHDCRKILDKADKNIRTQWEKYNNMLEELNEMYLVPNSQYNPIQYIQNFSEVMVSKLKQRPLLAIYLYLSPDLHRNLKLYIKNNMQWPSEIYTKFIEKIDEANVIIEEALNE